MSSITIKNATQAATANLTDRLPVSQGDDQAKTLTVVQIVNRANREDITFAGLLAAQTGGTLRPGQRYRITDYATVRLVENSSAAASWQEEIEPLTVTAKSTTRIHSIATSELFPDDVIYYTTAPPIENDSDMYNAGLPHTGVIYYRKDVYYNIESNCDWRGIKVRRYQTSLGSGIFSEIYDQGAGYLDVYPIGNQRTINPASQMFNISIGSQNMVAGADSPEIKQFLPDVSIGYGSKQIYVKDQAAPVAIGARNGSITIGALSNAIHVGEDCNSIDVGAGSSAIRFGVNCYQVTVPRYSSGVTFPDATQNPLDIAPQVVNTDHGSIVALVNSSGLTPGMNYLIQDFATDHLIAGAGTWASVTTEPLIVTAISPAALSPIAVSTTYPQDVILYELVNTATVAGGYSRGRIIHRHDIINNISAYSDWRHILTRRWNTQSNGSGTFTVIADNGFPFVDSLLFGSAAPSALTHYNIKIGTPTSTDGISRDRYNSVFLGTVFGCSFGDGFNDNTVGDDCAGNTSAGNFYSNKIGASFRSNSLGFEFSGNNIGDMFASNLIGSLFNTNQIGSSFMANLISGQFAGNTIGYNCRDNVFDNDYSTNTIGDQFTNNRTGVAAMRNTFGNECHGLNIGPAAHDNIFGDNCVSSDIGALFTSNKIPGGMAQCRFKPSLGYIEFPPSFLLDTEILPSSSNCVGTMDLSGNKDMATAYDPALTPTTRDIRHCGIVRLLASAVNSLSTMSNMPGHPVTFIAAAGTTKTFNCTAFASINANGQIMGSANIVLVGNNADEATFKPATITNGNGTFTVLRRVGLT